jgi:hypothetical protein
MEMGASHLARVQAMLAKAEAEDAVIIEEAAAPDEAKE